MANKCMISQPMAGLSEEQIQTTREKAIKAIEEAGYDFQDSYIDSSEIEKNEDNLLNKDIDDEDDINTSVLYLAKSIEKMAYCKAVYFCKGWEKARGCVIEHEVAQKYDLTCIYE